MVRVGKRTGGIHTDSGVWMRGRPHCPVGERPLAGESHTDHVLNPVRFENSVEPMRGCHFGESVARRRALYSPIANVLADDQGHTLKCLELLMRRSRR